MNIRVWKEAQAPVLVLCGLLLAPSGATSSAAQGQAADDWCRNEGQGGDRESVCEVREFTVAATAGTLEVQGTNGGIQVTGETRGDVHVAARIVARAATDARAREIASAVVLNPTSERVEAEGPRNLGDGEGWSVSYRLAVPRVLDLSLRTTNGGISIQEIESTVAFATTNGGVKLKGVSGDVKGRTTNGGVDVELDGGGWVGEGLDVQTTNGGVRLTVPETYSAQLEVHTRNGGMNVDVPGANRDRRARDVSVQLGSGGAPIRLRTSNGGVRVSRKE
jgi:DUF4097 and DUF4098 domain-containing protein YvlB